MDQRAGERMTVGAMLFVSHEPDSSWVICERQYRINWAHWYHNQKASGHLYAFIGLIPYAVTLSPFLSYKQIPVYGYTHIHTFMGSSRNSVRSVLLDAPQIALIATIIRSIHYVPSRISII